MTDSPSTRVVVIFGGRSAEHEVSCASAATVLRNLDPDRYDVIPVGVRRDGTWVLAEQAAAPGGPESGRETTALAASLVAEGATVTPAEVLAVGSPTVFPLIHGPFGEDGSIQGLCEMAGVAYVGSGVLGSAICMDKIITKRLLIEAGIPVARFIGLRQWSVDSKLEARVETELGWPVFVKPANLGSSVGVSKVGGGEELRAAVELALSYDEWVLVEEAIPGREIECGVLGDRHPEASVPGEVRPAGAFYDYADKYLDGRAGLDVPADLNDEITAAVQGVAVSAFKALRAEGMARVDLFHDEGGRGLVVNEVNTIPGFTAISMFPRMWEASGVAYAELVDRLLGLAAERHARRTRRLDPGSRAAGPPGAR